MRLTTSAIAAFSAQSGSGLIRWLWAKKCPVPKYIALAPIESEPRLSSDLSAAELATGRPATRRSAASRTLVLVTENEPAFLQVIRRHLDRHAVAGQSLDPVLFHLACGVGHDLVSCIELHAVTCVGEDFGHQSFELDHLFLSHGYLQVDRRLARSL